MKKVEPLVVGGLISIFLLLIIITVNFRYPEFLSLKTKWLAIAIIPTIITLITGKYIKSYKGFGVETESFFTETIPEKNLSQALTGLPLWMF